MIVYIGAPPVQSVPFEDLLNFLFTGVTECGYLVLSIFDLNTIFSSYHSCTQHRMHADKRFTAMGQRGVILAGLRIIFPEQSDDKIDNASQIFTA